MKSDLLSAFGRTDPDEPVIGSIKTSQPEGFSDTKKSKKKSGKAEAAEPDQPKIFPGNKYITVAHLLPQHTDVSEDFMTVFARYATLGSLEFSDTL